MTSNIRKPRLTGNQATAHIKTGTCNSTLFREIVSIAVVGLLLAVIMTDAVVGMSSGFAPSSEVGFTLAGMVADGR